MIKEHTTPGKGKTVSVPGQPDVKAIAFENDLYHIFQEQHDRIDLFVKSKAREIQHRLGMQSIAMRNAGTWWLTLTGQMMRRSD